MNGAASSYASLDYSLLHNGDLSIREGPDYVRGTREDDGTWISVKPGDHIIFSAWIKTASWAGSGLNAYSGAEIGWDYYISSSHGYGIATVDAEGHQAGHPNDAEIANNYSSLTGGKTYVPWGTDWTLMTWDFNVPNTYYNYVTTNGVYSCSPVQINSMVPWWGGRDVTANASCWFADPVFMVNPSEPPTIGVTTSSFGIKVTSIFSQQSIVESGFILPIVLAMQNIGNSTETVTAQLVATSNLSPQVYTIYDSQVTLDGGSSINLNCSFDTKNFPIGNYTITAYLSSSYGFTTTLCPTTVGVTYIGDLNGDFVVNFNDLLSFVQDYSSYWNGGQFNSAADFNHDGIINFEDLTAFASAYIIYWNQN